MKKIFFLLFLLAMVKVGYAQQAAATAPQGDLAAIKWENENFDFGKIKQGIPATHEFKFTNTGKAPLVITEAKASCGCTTPDWTRTPVAPGATGYIKATFNAGVTGPFNKSVTVYANIQSGVAVILFKGEVLAPAPAQ